jgi:hypothetical protein
MKKYYLIVLIVMITITSVPSQSDTLYRVEITIAAFPTFSYFKEERYPGAPDNVSFGYGTIARALWHPGKMVAFGIMSGYIFLAEDEFGVPTNSPESLEYAKARLDAVPLQAIVSMQKNEIEVGLGMGPYILYSTINYGSKSRGRRFELGLTLYGVYNFKIDKGLFLGPEIRLLYLSYRGIFSVMPSLTLRYDLWKY